MFGTRAPALSASAFFGAAPRRFGAAFRYFVQRFRAWCLALQRLGLGASARAPSVHDARCSTFGAYQRSTCTPTFQRSVRKYSTLNGRCLNMSGFHRCVTCQAKLPANDPHEDCVACCVCLGRQVVLHIVRQFSDTHSSPEGEESGWGSSGSSHTLSALPLATPPVRLQLSRSPSSQLTAGQRSPTRHTRGRSRSPSPRRVRPRRESRSHWIPTTLCGLWLRISLSSQSGHRNTTGAGHCHSSSRNHGVIKSPLQVHQCVANPRL
ncbi:UNVERIFIED_CONTAM: hypothetical protein FKN15_036489 [Acipenser sinensis]